MRVALVVGHSQKSKGAANKNYEVNEFDFNRALAHDIEHNFAEYNLVDEIVVIYRETNYLNLPFEINEYEPDFVISLHCNAYNTQASGCEMLYYYKSEVGKELARVFYNGLVNLLGNKDRGLKARSVEDRGGYLLRYTQAPCIIAEPFFIDNDSDFLNAKEKFESGELTDVYCKCINEALKMMKEQNAKSN